MKVKVYVVDKKGKKELYEPLIRHYQKLCRPWADVELHEVFGKEIARAQEQNAEAAQAAYSRALERYLPGGYNVALDPQGEMVDSPRFADLLRDRPVVNFFIGGAYGFEKEFLRHSNKNVSFGRITLSHKLVKVVLMEQIFRALSIIHHHPYHK
ncbi:23S rRNA (pseudouridine(1915)-N(3))-methyltransferase RlmH [Nitratifractor sp.]